MQADVAEEEEEEEDTEDETEKISFIDRPIRNDVTEPKIKPSNHGTDNMISYQSPNQISSHKIVENNLKVCTSVWSFCSGS